MAYLYQLRLSVGSDPRAGTTAKRTKPSGPFKVRRTLRGLPPSKLHAPTSQAPMMLPSHASAWKGRPSMSKSMRIMRRTIGSLAPSAVQRLPRPVVDEAFAHARVPVWFRSGDLPAGDPNLPLLARAMTALPGAGVVTDQRRDGLISARIAARRGALLARVAGPNGCARQTLGVVPGPRAPPRCRTAGGVPAPVLREDDR
jgi:hypothetical protein